MPAEEDPTVRTVTKGEATKPTAQTPEEMIRQHAGAVKIGLRSKKGSGFWKSPETVSTLRDYNDGKITAEQAMQRLGVGRDIVALRYYANRLKASGTTVREKAKAPYQSESIRRSAAEWLVLLLLERSRKIASQSYTQHDDKHLRGICSLLLWKHSEAEGKYGGCRYWSSGAIKSRKRHGRQVTKVSESDALIHEHVFPRGQLTDLLFKISSPTYEKVRKLLDRLNIGVVITRAEHKRLPLDGDPENPLSRYHTADIVVHDRHVKGRIVEAEIA